MLRVWTSSISDSVMESAGRQKQCFSFSKAFGLSHLFLSLLSTQNISWEQHFFHSFVKGSSNVISHYNNSTMLGHKVRHVFVYLAIYSTFTIFHWSFLPFKLLVFTAARRINVKKKARDIKSCYSFWSISFLLTSSWILIIKSPFLNPDRN